MKKQFIFAVAFLAASTMFFSCNKSSDEDDDDSTTETITLSGEITEDFTIAASTTCSLDGAVIVKSGATLTIEEGVSIVAVDDFTDDYILVEQGAKIYAVGTADDPIIMRGEDSESGMWHGLHICGNAQTNSTTSTTYIGDAAYGGSDDSDSSGTLQYIIIKYAGDTYDDTGVPSSGITFYGVGSGTDISYIQTYRCAGNGFEFKGGAANVKYLLATSSAYSSFAWSEGWRGKGQFLIGFQEQESIIEYGCGTLISGVNNEDNESATPTSHPILSNLTLVGSNSYSDNNAVVLTSGTEVEIYNAIITGKDYPIITKSSTTESSLKSSLSVFDNIYMSGALYSTEGIYTNSDFLASGSNISSYINCLDDNYYGTVDSDSGSTPVDSFFTAADYRGALADDDDDDTDWTYDWSVTCKEFPTGTISGEYITDITLAEGNTFYLDGALIIKSGVILTIEEGVTIVAVEDDVDDYIIIEQGATIYAEARATNPIVLTSEKKEAGAWGGLHICGYASVSGDSGVSHLGDAAYGGSDDTDDSGTLKYFRIEYAGCDLSSGDKSGGLSLYGVGNTTSISYLQTYRCAGDGVKLLGGTVDLQFLKSTSCAGASFDFSQGWRGNGQFIVAYQESENILGYDCGALIECGDDSDQSSTLTTHPVLSNLTLVGNNSTTNIEGVVLKSSTEIELCNSIITGKTSPIVTQSTEVEQSLVDGSSIVNYVAMSGEFDATESIYSNELFEASTGNSTDYVNTLTDNYYGLEDGGVSLCDDFFSETDYKGAIESDVNWTYGWSL